MTTPRANAQLQDEVVPCKKCGLPFRRTEHAIRRSKYVCAPCYRTAQRFKDSGSSPIANSPPNSVWQWCGGQSRASSEN